jgi:hypothetical protein
MREARMGLKDIFKNAFSKEPEADVSTPYVMQVAGSMLTVTIHEDFLLLEKTGMGDGAPETIPLGDIVMVKMKAFALGISSLSIIVRSGRGIEYKFANKVAATGKALIERLMKKP